MNVIQWIEPGVEIPFTQILAEPIVFRNKNFNKKRNTTSRQGNPGSCYQKCIEKCEVRPFVVSLISLVQKKNESLCLMTDLRHLNSVCKPNKFPHDLQGSIFSSLLRLNASHLTYFGTLMVPSKYDFFSVFG